MYRICHRRYPCAFSIMMEQWSPAGQCPATPEMQQRARLFSFSSAPSRGPLPRHRASAALPTCHNETYGEHSPEMTTRIIAPMTAMMSAPGKPYCATENRLKWLTAKLVPIAPMAPNNRSPKEAQAAIWEGSTGAACSAPGPYDKRCTNASASPDKSLDSSSRVCYRGECNLE